MRILQRTQETDDVFTLELEVSGHPQGFRFAPGQFNMLWAFGAGEVAISVSGSAADGTRLLHTIRAVGSVTRILSDLKAGNVIGVRGPNGTGWPVDASQGRDVVVVAGGLGLAPLRPAIEALAARAGQGGRLMVLAGARTPDDLLFQADLARWRGMPGVQVEMAVDRAGPGWREQVGVVPALLDFLTLDPARTVALLCGPEVMMRFAARALLALGLAPADIHLSLERNMKCAVGFCGHCQLGPFFICRQGPVLPADRLAGWFEVREM
jgi:NAD(P)H-flavin reductase